ncbi:hypothetical protein DYB28_004488, partial [Aphanomyces astaci]
MLRRLQKSYLSFLWSTLCLKDHRSRPTSVADFSTRRKLSNDERVAAYQLLLERTIGVRSAIDIKTAIKAVPHEGRQTLRSTAALSGIPKTAILRHMKEPHGLAARTSQLKPLLTDDNMLERLWFAVSFKQIFDGKIGIWPFVEEVAAVRSSKNRPKGTLELAPQSVNADGYQDMVMNEVVPAIQVKMPRGVVVKLQLDNASPHRCVTTELIAHHGVDSIEVANQPPNVLDLEFYKSVQSLQQQKVARSIGELIAAVEEAFYELPVTILGKTFITLQKV